MQNACAILSSVACPALKYFSTSSHIRKDFFKKKIEHRTCVGFFLHLLSETFLILRRAALDMIRNVDWSSCKLSVILVGF